MQPPDCVGARESFDPEPGVTVESNGEPTRRPLLILISDSEAVPARLRSRHREVVRWVPNGSARKEHTFSGDPADPRCYEWARDALAVTAVIDLRSPERVRAALAALRSVRSDAAVLLISTDVEDLDQADDGTVARRGELRDVLRLDLDDELQRLEAARRAFCLREFAAGDETVPILIHDDPDPDALSSALAVATLLGASPARTPIVTLEPMTRPENRRMAELLNIKVTRITAAELRRFKRVITVDTQPRQLQVDGRPRFAVIDHHPPESASYSAEFVDIRPSYGATATMMTEYLRAGDDRRVNCSLATALLYGIRTDTDSLTRGVTPADVEAYAFLQERADPQLVRRMERPSFAPETAHAFGQALSEMEFDNELCVADLGELPADQAHVLADLADFCLNVKNVTWVVAVALIDGELVLTLRHVGHGPGAGEVARALVQRGGRGGGHATMARAMLPAEQVDALMSAAGSEARTAPAIRRLIREVMDELNAVASRPG
jgi:nanoRNase/pAp phosphatase (c-di-AMP/oligoRNAs hydrolase)